MKRRLVWLLSGLLLSVFVGYAGWLIWQVRGDLVAAQASATRLTQALEAGDEAAAQRASTDLEVAAAAAASRTGGPAWSALTVLPLIGDDAGGVRALAQSLDVVGRGAVPAMVETVGLLDGLQRKGGVNVEVTRALAAPVAQAHDAISEAHTEVADVDSSGFAGPVRGRFDRYVDLLAEARTSLRSAETASEVLPSMLGGDGPRDYLLVFQNNAEIRGTGGLPGSWALVHANQGRLRIGLQGSLRDFPYRSEPVLPLTKGEQAVYTKLLGTFFHDTNLTPDFPRAAELMDAHWQRRFPGTELDGVISLDPVAMSYLLEGTGPITAAGQTLTSENLVESLLSRPYIELDPEQQDLLFAETARGIFDAITGDLESPVAVVRGLSRAAEEGRFLVAPFVAAEAEALEGSEVLGAMPEDDGETPHMQVVLNDGTASKMSYYLRYGAEVRATRCEEGRQQLQGSLWLRQAIEPSQAAELPQSVTGPGRGIKRGQQLVNIKLIGPHGGKLSNIRIGSKQITMSPDRIEGRPAMTLFVFLDSTDDVVVNWSATSGGGQTGDGLLGVTPGIVPGDKDAVIPSAC